MRGPAAIAAALLLAGCAGGPSAVRTAADQAYILGAADAVKQLYWAKQALEAPGATRPAGRTMYYSWEESGAARDGRRLAPEKVYVPVFVPDPAPAAQRP